MRTFKFDGWFSNISRDVGMSSNLGVSIGDVGGVGSDGKQKMMIQILCSSHLTNFTKLRDQKEREFDLVLSTSTECPRHAK